MLADSGLQKAVFDRISTDPQIAQIMGQPVAEFFDYVPENTTFPYINYQLVQSVENDTSTEESFETVFALHVWSTKEGTKETNQILQRIYRLFHNRPDNLVLELYKVVNLQFQVSEVLRDPDGATYHGVIRFRAVLDNLEIGTP